MLRTVLLRAADSEPLARYVTGRGWTRRLALRYVAGESLDDGLRAVRELAKQGRTATLDYLGESVTDPQMARAAADVYIAALDSINDEGLPCGVSVKPTQMGLSFDPDLCRSLLAEIAAAATRADTHLTLDMEGSDVTEATVALVEHLQAEGHACAGCAVQTYLHRTGDDVKRLTAAGASLRVCKGAYAEPASIAYRRPRDIAVHYVACADWLLEHGNYPRFATHDERLVERICHRADGLGIPREAYEFQMLYGVRPSLQERMVADGYRLRVYVPFGDDWYRYFVRRIGERPANLLFFLRSLRDT